jgi:3-oxoacyl-[acyl-carrier-protein] synthase-3
LDEPGKATSDLAVGAILPMLKKKGVDPSEIELIICGTVTGDYVFPATANVIADKIGAVNAWGYDVGAACSGFLFALVTGSKFIESGAHKKVLVVGADKMSSIVDYTDRNTCVLFGDGAGCVLLEPSEDGLGIQDTITRVDGSGREFLIQKAGGSMLPPSHETIDQRLHYAYQEGKTVFKFAVTRMADVSYEIMERNQLKAEDIAWLVPHQANLRIIDATADRMGLDKNKVMINIQKYGNTTSGTLPLCLWEWESQLKKGDNIILSSFGGGFTWGSIYLKWAYDSN